MSYGVGQHTLLHVGDWKGRGEEIWREEKEEEQEEEEENEGGNRYLYIFSYVQ